jgi:ubiquinone/menaquinone biosynthesis C-methylase UbiE
MNNVQTFSSGSEQYAKHRPQYPAELFSYLSELAHSHDRAWDCATGNGQSAVSCAKYFSRVEATDLSAEQIQHGIARPNVKYSVCPAEHTPFMDNSFDLITVATAIHWFDQEKFFQEVKRVLKPQGILAIWGYSFLGIEPAIDEMTNKVLLKPIRPFWAEGNRQVMNGYPNLTLPFDEIRNPPTFTIQIEWTLQQFLAYVRTWSAVKRYMTELGNDPVSELESQLKTIWSEPDQTKTVHMPLVFKASRKPA